MADENPEKNETVSIGIPKRSNIRLFMEYMDATIKYSAEPEAARQELEDLKVEMRERAETVIDQNGNRIFRVSLNARTPMSRTGNLRAGMRLGEESAGLENEELGFADEIAQAKQELDAIREHIAKTDRLLSQEKKLIGPTNRPSSFLLELVLPIAISRDFIANMEIIHDDTWLPRYGIRRARWLWHSQALRKIVDHWLDAVVGILTRIRKIIY